MNIAQAENDDDIQLPKDPFAYIAFWQFLTFIILLLLIWLNEFRDMQAFFFNNKEEGVNIFRGFILTAGVFLTAIIAIGNTYIQQNRVLKALISVCANCHRVQIRKNVWSRMEDYVSDQSLLTFTHGLCPVCMAEMMQEIEARSGNKKNKELVPSAGE
ncbi:MAG: hypothetical protein KKE37_01805 [Verrucomicrobia bacterium]|nr:hypothetical protein [Verrucomicrobiota bacterium]MBU4290032.1 hypothetical protein [Verrucomicrobiota bacterium]MBU4428071.1 hypothetical protein [Verrucomicrobiota bacterium]MCG2679597.1 hypothetical protein [Kiritimatiellia bacterium]